MSFITRVSGCVFVVWSSESLNQFAVYVILRHCVFINILKQIKSRSFLVDHCLFDVDSSG
jgi:hypothetical protein